MSSQPFLPTQIPGCILWFDPSDRTTVTSSGNQVLQLTNKGTLNTFASNIRATGSIPSPWASWPPPGDTTIGTNIFNTSPLSTIRFTQTFGSGDEYGNGYNGSYLTIDNVITSSKSRTIFAIIGITTSGIDDYFRLFGTANVSDTGTNSNYTGFLNYSAPGFTRFPVSYGATEEFSFGNTPPFIPPINTDGYPYIFGVRHTTLTTSNYATVNGTNQNFNVNSALDNGYATGSDQMIIGIGAGYTREFYLGELIYFDGELTDLEMRQMEGYLSWKWGNQTQLPITHPYRNAAPTGSNIFMPTQVNLVNTNATPGTLTLPSTFTQTGRIITFKDQTGTFNSNALTLATNNPNQTFDSGLSSMLVNTRLGWLSLIANTNNRWMTIGGTVLNTVNASTINTNQISTSQIASQNIITSSFAIIDQSFGSTTQLYTSSSLLYYNNGVTNVILAGTRQSFGGNFVASTGPFSPTQIAGLQLWLDSADQNTLRLSGSSVTRWVDKSSNAIPLTVSTGNPQITRFNSLPSVFFNGSSRMEFLNYTRTSGATNINWFVVANIQNTNLSYGLLIGTIYANNFFSQNSLYVDTNRSLLFYRIANLQPSFNSGSSISSVPIITSSSVNLTLGTYTVYVNGVGTTQTGGPTGTQDSTSVNLYLGNDNYPGDAFITGTISECLLYTSALTPQQRESVEGYLAWKWNLVQNLPADHPYKNFPPTRFTIFNQPYFVSITGGASPTFTIDYNLTAGNTNTASDIFIYTVGQSLVANTTSSFFPAFLFTTDGTTNATTGKLTANLTFNTGYIARARINISPSIGQVFSDYSTTFLYGAGPSVAPTMGAYSGGATMSIAWTPPATTNAQPITGSNIYFSTDAAGLTRVASNVNYTGGSPFTTAGNTNFTNGSLTFNTNYYALVQMSNVLGTSLGISASPALFGVASVAPTIGTLTGGATLTVTWTNTGSSYARPTTFNQMYIYTDSGGTVLATTSTAFSSNTSFSTDGTIASGSLNANLTFNTTYYARVASSNALNASWSNSSGVTGSALYGAAPQPGTITFYTGGATMTATLGSTATNAQPIASSNIIFLATDETTVIATKNGYTGGSSYSTTGSNTDFSSGSLTFNTFYFLRLDLVNARGTSQKKSDVSARFGDIPSASPSGISYSAGTYYGTIIPMTWTAPGAGTLAQPVTNVVVKYKNSSTGDIYTGNYWALTNSQTSYNVDTGVYGISINLGLISVNALGGPATVYGTNAVVQYEASLTSYYNYTNTGSGTPSQSFNTSRSSTTVSGFASARRFLSFNIDVNIIPGKTKTLSWSVSATNLGTQGITVNGSSVGNSGSTSVTNGIVLGYSCAGAGSTTDNNFTLTFTLT